MKFRGHYYFLSNMFPAKITIGGQTYLSSEHAYQAAKCASSTDAANIRSAPTPYEAKRRAKKVQIRKGWNDMRLAIMKQVVEAKFAHNPNLLNHLRAITGEIVEENWWNDTFWGVCEGKGHNNLGKILMNIRDNTHTLEAHDGPPRNV